MRTTYVRESERGEKEKRGETELEEGGEMTNRWRQTVGRKEIEKKGSTWLTVPPPPTPHIRTLCSKKSWATTNDSYIYLSNSHLKIFASPPQMVVEKKKPRFPQIYIQRNNLWV